MYFLRLELGLDDLRRADVIIEYSVTNLVHIKVSGLYPASICNKFVYMPALYFPYETKAKDHRKFTISTCIINVHGRRKDLLQSFKDKGVEVENHGFNSYEEEMDVWDNTKILVNVHQASYFKTIEELRLVPALSRGVVIVSETDPRVDLLPYYDYIIFCKYEELASKAIEVSEHYDEYYKKFFGSDSELPEILNDMKQKSFNHLEKLMVKAHARRD